MPKKKYSLKEKLDHYVSRSNNKNLSRSKRVYALNKVIDLAPLSDLPYEAQKLRHERSLLKIISDPKNSKKNTRARIKKWTDSLLNN